MTLLDDALAKENEELKNGWLDKQSLIVEENTSLRESLKLAVSLLKYELDTDSVNAVMDYIERKEEFLAKITAKHGEL